LNRRLTPDKSSLVNDYRRLHVWERSRGLVQEVYRISEAWPRREWFGLTSQARRAAVSVPSNIAEGAGRGSGREFARFVRIAVGSLCELETLFVLAGDLGYAVGDNGARILSESVELRRMLGRLAERAADDSAPE
jgi:four helix bundle protein